MHMLFTEGFTHGAFLLSDCVYVKATAGDMSMLLGSFRKFRSPHFCSFEIIFIKPEASDLMYLLIMLDSAASEQLNTFISLIVKNACA